jgi:Membrane bound FAD containing D-sorbitol dehydrogenase
MVLQEVLMSDRTNFEAISKILTGAGALAPALVAEYLDRIRIVYGDEFTRFMAASSKGTAADLSAIENDDALRYLATQIIRIWYTGEFFGPQVIVDSKPVDGRSYPPTQTQYRSGMLWEIIQAHPPAYSLQNYGYWAVSP